MGSHAYAKQTAFDINSHHQLDRTAITRTLNFVGDADQLAILESAIHRHFLALGVLHGEGVLDRIVVVQFCRNHLGQRVQPVLKGAVDDGRGRKGTGDGEGDTEHQGEQAENDRVLEVLHDFALSGKGSPLRVRPNPRGRVY